MAKCKRCGSDIEPGQKMCDNCGLRLAASKEGEGGSGLRLAGGSQPPADQAQQPAAPDPPPAVPPSPPPASAEAPQDPRQQPSTSLSLASGGAQPGAPAAATVAPESGEKTLCPECMQSFDAAHMTDFHGKLYCPSCIAKVSKGKDKPRGQAAVEVAGGGPVEQRSPALLKLLVILGFIALIVGVAFGVYYVITKEAPVTPPEPSDDIPGIDVGPLKVQSGKQAKEYPAIKVPVSKGERFFQCPVCAGTVGAVGTIQVECSGCGRRLNPTLAEFPDVKYVAKEGDTAILKHEKKDLRAKPGEEVLPGSGVKVRKLTKAGLILEKTVTIRFQDHTKEQEGDTERKVVVHKTIPKFRESGPIHMKVMRGTKSIICDGKWKNRVYHKDTVIIPLEYMEPGTYTISCANADCWNIFEVVVTDYPEIRVPITKQTATVLCPQCGAERYLETRGRPVVFRCAGCDRQIALYLWTVQDVSFVRREGDVAVIRHKGKICQVRVGGELVPKSGIRLKQFGEEEGRECLVVTAQVDVKFQDFKDGKGKDNSKLIPLEDRIPKGGE